MLLNHRVTKNRHCVTKGNVSVTDFNKRKIVGEVSTNREKLSAVQGNLLNCEI